MEPKTIALPKITAQPLEYSLLFASFFLPFLISGPQLLTGTIVNMLLFLFVAKTSSTKTLPMILLPSIGAVLNGILFGTFTPFLLYFLPFIWIGNYALIRSFAFLMKKNSFIVSVIGSSLIKSAVLFSAAFAFTSLNIVPRIFLQAMGVFQLMTAVAGGIVAWGIYTIFSKRV